MNIVDDKELLLQLREDEELSLLDKLQPLKNSFCGNFANPTCRECIKYYNEHKGGHRIDCKGIPQGVDWVPENIRATMSDEELTRALITIDPVRWLKVYLGWEAREYQADYLRCTSRRKCGRFARRAGKTEMCAADALHGVVTQAGVPLIDGEKRGCRILILTPYSDQIVNIFMKLEAFLERNTEIANMVTRYVKNPYFMQFSNGSWILGKPAGTKSGAGAVSTKGWGADRYLADEADYLADSDYATLMPMLTEHAHTRFSAISTPSGKRQKFWSMCNDKHYKEFWVTCYKRPGWNKQMEEEARSECPTKLDFIHEHEADWGVAEGGVFNIEYVKDALYDYTYYSDKQPDDLPSFAFDKEWTYCIGVDLNEKYGLAACVLGWNPSDEYWYIVDTGGVEKSEYTQVAGMNLLVDLNRRWNPKFIYMDKKPSTTSFEVLKRYGIEQARKKSGAVNPDARLAYILKQFDFGSKIDAPDLTGKIVKRVVKPFMIGLAVRRFEQRQIRFPRKDTVLHQQIVDYEQRITPAANVVYEPGNQGDHLLDALMLAIMAFALEFSQLGKVHQAIGLAIGPSFGKSDSTLKTRETAVVGRAIHVLPSHRLNAYERMKRKMLKAIDDKARKANVGGRRREIKTDLRRHR